MGKKVLFGCLTLLLLSVGLPAATTLSSNLAEVHLENLQIGGVYDIGQIASMSFWVGYSGEGQMTVKVIPLVPAVQELRPGFEAIPDVNWLRLDRETLTINGGEQSPLNLIVSIPYDEKYRGKSYQAMVLIQSVGAPSSGLGIGLGIKGKVFLKIADKSPDKDTARKKLPKGLARGVIIIPDKVYLDDVEKGKSVDLYSLIGERIKILNATQDVIKVSCEIVDPEKFGIAHSADYQSLSDKKMVGVSAEKMTIRPDGVKNLNVRLNLGKDISGDKFFSVVRMRIESKKLQIDQFIKIYVTTRNK